MTGGISATTIAIAAVATAAVGAGMSIYEGQQAAHAAAEAQQQAQEAQQRAFGQRLQANSERLAQQTEINKAAEQRFTENQAATQAAQTSALDERQKVIKATNEQTADIANRADLATTQGVQPANATGLASAQAQQAADQMAANQPIVEAVQATNPLGDAKGSSSVTAQATDERLKGAADYVKDYGDKAAALTAYSAPIATARNAATTIGTNLMPIGVADELVRTGAPTLLSPSSVAYQNAGQYGAAVDTANQRTQAGATAVSNTQADDQIGIANLEQQDTMNAIQSQLVRAQQNAALWAGIGSGLTSIGTAGLGFAGSQGAFASVKTPSAQTLLSAPSSPGAPVAWTIK